MTQSIYDSLMQAFEEDRNMVTAQHKNMQSPPQSPMMPLHFDAALVQFRKMVSEAKDVEDHQIAQA